MGEDVDKHTGVCSMVLTDDEFQLFSKLIYHESGIAIKEAKRDFLQTRLRKRLQSNRLQSYYRYYKLITDKTQGQRELIDLLDSLTINETSFFRNLPQFDIFANLVLPDLKKRKRDTFRLRVWSAGCSRGQEPYSIAMSLLEHLEDPFAWDIKIVASDISLRALDNAQKGHYTDAEVEVMAPPYRASYFDKTSSGYQIKQQVRKLVIFDYHNLKHENGLHHLDIIFCRNVMIYFDKDEQKRLIDKFHKSLSPGGYLFLGHTESLQGLSDDFKFIYHNKGAVYQKIG